MYKGVAVWHTSATVIVSMASWSKISWPYAHAVAVTAESYCTDQSYPCSHVTAHARSSGYAVPDPAKFCFEIPGNLQALLLGSTHQANATVGGNQLAKCGRRLAAESCHKAHEHNKQCAGLVDRDRLEPSLCPGSQVACQGCTGRGGSPEQESSRGNPQENRCLQQVPYTCLGCL